MNARGFCPVFALAVLITRGHLNMMFVGADVRQSLDSEVNVARVVIVSSRLGQWSETITAPACGCRWQGRH